MLLKGAAGYDDRVAAQQTLLSSLCLTLKMTDVRFQSALKAVVSLHRVILDHGRTENRWSLK